MLEIKLCSGFPSHLSVAYSPLHDLSLSTSQTLSLTSTLSVAHSTSAILAFLLAIPSSRIFLP